MDKNKKPTITQDLFEKATSQEAREALMRIDVEYQEKQSQLDNQQLTQDGNFYMGRIAGIHSNKDVQDYANNRRKAEVSLFDRYRSDAEKTFEDYHPEYLEDTQEIFTSNVKDVTVYTKSYNQGYYLFKSEPKLSQKVNIALKDKDSDTAQGLKDGAKQSANETNIEAHDNLKSRYLDNSRDITKAPDRDPDRE